ncbi:trypsin-1-like isoform X2 [Daphnia carinata]|uniref:trypsin-1-like isoform X2 n=1 Tax=Daphnia carinata TaxID=120202 RepID=UPI002868DC78|nr:trypsin-1-like isoform X2 [Daphnia carinata]
MKLIILAGLFVCAAAPQRTMVLPRLPMSVILNGKYQLIPEDKIVGGTEVTPNSLPFLISLQRKFLNTYTHSCGGTILSESTILTAAHCLDEVDPDLFRVVAGEHSLSVDSGIEQMGKLDNYTMHPEFDPLTLENDIALIYLKTRMYLNISETVQPINLPPPTTELDPPAGLSVTVAGWGTTSASGDVSDVLLSIEIPIVSDGDCNAAYAGEYNTHPVKESMMCAGGAPGGIDACQGDSGGPLFTSDNDGNVTQHGIVSWGRGCGLADYPGVYTQVSYFLDWINAEMMP